MNLLCDVLRERQRRNPDRLDPREREQVGGLDLLRLRGDRVDEADVDDELIEDAPGKLGSDVEAGGPGGSAGSGGMGGSGGTGGGTADPTDCIGGRDSDCPAGYWCSAKVCVATTKGKCSR